MISRTHLVDDHGVVDFALDEVLEGNILYSSSTDTLSCPRFDTCTVLSIGHGYVSIIDGR